jgi:hypothetical protein
VGGRKGGSHRSGTSAAPPPYLCGGSRPTAILATALLRFPPPPYQSGGSRPTAILATALLDFRPRLPERWLPPFRHPRHRTPRFPPPPYQSGGSHPSATLATALLE